MYLKNKLGKEERLEKDEDTGKMGMTRDENLEIHCYNEDIFAGQDL